MVNVGSPVHQVSCSKGEKHNHTSCVDWTGKLYSWGDPYKGNLAIKLKTANGAWDHTVKHLELSPKLSQIEEKV